MNACTPCCFSFAFLPPFSRPARTREVSSRRSSAVPPKQRRFTACKPTAPLPEALIALTSALKDEENAVNRYTALIQLGNKYQIPERLTTDIDSDNRVAGCISVVYVSTEVTPDDQVLLSGTSDSVVTRGILALLIIGTRDLSTETFLALNPQSIAAAAGLSASTGGASRTASLTRILQHAQNQVRDILNSSTTTRSVEKTATGRRRQKEDTAVLLSGGVDSAVALRLAQESGKRVRAFYLRIWLAEDEAYLGSCPWEDDIATARSVCEQAGVQLETVSLQNEYRDRVIEYVVREARSGRTPNPDVMCNSRVKFGAFYEYLFNQYDQFETVVSGHYAQVEPSENEAIKLRTSPDIVKDQTYFLAGLTQQQLTKAEFPLGRFDKSHVRYLANEKYKLANAQRPDSQGVCFLGKLKWRDFLKLHLGVNAGDFIEWETGRKVGVHEGFWFYTLGQRKGMGLCDGPWYVVSKHIETNTVFVSKQYWEEHMERREFTIEQAHWINDGIWPVDIGQQVKLKVKVRHGPYVHGATLKRTGQNAAHVTLDRSDKALAPGQFAVFYDGDECLGCAIIASGFLQRPTELITDTAKTESPSILIDIRR